jgi:sulfur carrier protein ThiS
MTIIVIVRKKEYQFEGKMTVKHILKELDLPLEAYLAVRDGNLLNEHEVLSDGETVRLVSVISGG